MLTHAVSRDLEFNAIWGARLSLAIIGAFWGATALVNSEAPPPPTPPTTTKS